MNMTTKPTIAGHNRKMMKNKEQQMLKKIKILHRAIQPTINCSLHNLHYSKKNMRMMTHKEHIKIKTLVIWGL